MIFDGYQAIFPSCCVPSSWEDHKWQKTKHIHRRGLAALSGKIQRSSLSLQLSAGGLIVFLPCSFASGSGLVLVPCSNEEDLSITLFLMGWVIVTCHLMIYISTFVVRYAIFTHAIFLDAKCEASPWVWVGLSLGAVHILHKLFYRLTQSRIEYIICYAFIGRLYVNR